MKNITQSIIPFSNVLESKYSPLPKMTNKHHDSLIFSITTQKNMQSSQKQTILLESQKYQDQYLPYTDIQTLQNKLKKLQEKVQNITTQYCEDIQIQTDNDKNSQHYFSEKENLNPNKKIVKTVYYQKQIQNSNICIEQKNQRIDDIGKIRRKSLHKKYYSKMEPVIYGEGKQQQKINKKNNDGQKVMIKSKLKTNKNYGQCVLDQSLKSRRSISSKINHDYHETSLQIRQKSREISQLKQKLLKTRLSQQKISRQRSSSQSKLSTSKNYIKELRKQNFNQAKTIQKLLKELKKNQIVRQKQKQIIKRQREQIKNLKLKNEQFLIQNQKKGQHFNLNQKNLR